MFEKNLFSKGDDFRLEIIIEFPSLHHAFFQWLIEIRDYFAFSKTLFKLKNDKTIKVLFESSKYIKKVMWIIISRNFFT